jgi:hypothetical protein
MSTLYLFEESPRRRRDPERDDAFQDEPIMSHTTIRRVRLAIAALAGGLLIAAPSRADLVTRYSLEDDREVKKAGNTYENTNSNSLRVGRVGSGTAENRLRNAILVFDLSGITDTIVGAELSVYYNDSTGDPSFNVDLYGLGFRTTPDFFSPSGFEYHGANAPDSPYTLLLNNFITPSTSDDQYRSTTSNLLSYINSRPAGANYVFFRLNNDAEPTSGNKYYEFRSGNDSHKEPKLKLTTQAVDVAALPEPSTLASGALGAVALAMVVRRRRSR